MPVIAAGVGLAELGIGIAQKAKANRDAKAALARRKAYSTPVELYKILNATQSNAQTGFDPATLQYLTNESDRGFDAALSTVQKLGGDPNDASALFDQKIQGLMKIGEENHLQNTQNFSQYLSALNSVGESKTAEWQSQQNLVKDLQQKAAQDKADSTQQISDGLNTGLSAAAAIAESNLYKEGETDKYTQAFGSQGKSAESFAKQNNMSFSKYKSTWDQYGSKFANFNM